MNLAAMSVCRGSHTVALMEGIRKSHVTVEIAEMMRECPRQPFERKMDVVDEASILRLAQIHCTLLHALSNTPETRSMKHDEA